MAISEERWEKAKTLFETGEFSLSQISRETGIAKSTISKEAKKKQWKSGEQADYIEAKVLIAEKKSTLNVEKINTLDEVANIVLRRKNLIFQTSEKAVQRINEMLDIVEDAKSLKDLTDALDKSSLTLNVNARHANTNIIQNSNVSTSSELKLSKTEINEILKESEEI